MTYYEGISNIFTVVMSIEMCQNLISFILEINNWLNYFEKRLYVKVYGVKLYREKPKM